MSPSSAGGDRFTRNVFSAFGRQLAAGLLSLVTAALIARVFGPEGNGAQAVAMLLPTMLGAFLNLGVAPANVYHLASGRMDAQSILRANCLLGLAFSVLGCALGLGLILGAGDRFFPGVETRILLLALAAFPAILFNGYLGSIFQGLQRFRPFNLLLLLQPVSLLGCVLVLALTGMPDLLWLVGMQLLSHLLPLAVGAFWITRDMPERRRGEPAISDAVQRSLAYGWKAHLSNILAFVNYKADVFLVNVFLGPAAVGVYVIAVAMAEKLWLISQAVSSVLLPRLSELESQEDERRRLTSLTARSVLAITALGACFAAVLGGPFIRIVFGLDYLVGLTALWYLLPGIVFGAASRILANDLAARGRPELNMYTAIAVVMINVACNVLFIPRFGIEGAALATSIAYGVNLVLRLAIHSRITGSRWADSMLIRRDDFARLALLLRRGREA